MRLKALKMWWKRRRGHVRGMAFPYTADSQRGTCLFEMTPEALAYVVRMLRGAGLKVEEQGQVHLGGILTVWIPVEGEE